MEQFPLTKDEIKTELTIFRDGAKKIMMSGQDLVPFLFLYLFNPETNQVSKLAAPAEISELYFRDKQRKYTQALIKKLKESLLRDDGLILFGVLTISEAWMIKRDKDIDRQNVHPSAEADRIETYFVCFQAEDSEHTAILSGKIIRDTKTNKVCGLEDLVDDPFSGQTKGIFSDSLT